MKMLDVLFYLSVALLCFALVALINLPAYAEDSAAAAPKTFNDYVLEVLQSYPTDGSYPYDWVNEPNYFGITKDLFYQGEQFVTGDAKKRSYCSGITFEVFFQAYELYNQEHGYQRVGNLVTTKDMEEFRRNWYGVGGNKLTIKNALESTGLGYQLTDLTQVKPGDFVQIWRWSGSGHTVVFIDWVKDTNNNLIGFKYWSSNSGTGLSYREEYFGDSGKTIKKEETYFMRVIEPTEYWANHQE